MSTSPNQDTSIARRFHDATSYISVPADDGSWQLVMGTPEDYQEGLWEKDWAIEPFPYKVYETLPPIALPYEFPPTEMPALDALSGNGGSADGERIPTLSDLARIALLSNGILKRGSHRPGGRIIEYRAAGGTGARYHLECYFVTGDLPDLAAGIYHYSAQDHSLRQLRAGDFRAAVIEASGEEPGIAHAPAVLIMTSTFWRNSWRYKGRAYRHALWDAGTTLANVLAVADSADLPTELVLGFADGEINQLIDVDGVREAALALVAIGRTDRSAPAAPATEPLDFPTKPISRYQIDFPDIGAMHAGSSLASGAEAAAWRANPLRRTALEAAGEVVPLQPLDGADLPALTIDDLIRRRRSTRHYDTDASIPFEAFSTVVSLAMQPVANDVVPSDALPLHDQYFIVHRVAGLADGVYRARPLDNAIELIRAGNFRPDAERLAVGQYYAGEAHVNSYALAELDAILDRYGNRGYRAAQLLAALTANRMHVATHAVGLGAVGSTSLDHEVVDFFAPGEPPASYLFVTVFGKRKRSNDAA